MSSHMNKESIGNHKVACVNKHAPPPNIYSKLEMFFENVWTKYHAEAHQECLTKEPRSTLEMSFVRITQKLTKNVWETDLQEQECQLVTN